MGAHVVLVFGVWRLNILLFSINLFWNCRITVFGLMRRSIVAKSIMSFLVELRLESFWYFLVLNLINLLHILCLLCCKVLHVSFGVVFWGGSL